jgi:hypothetical protein
VGHVLLLLLLLLLQMDRYCNLVVKVLRYRSEVRVRFPELPDFLRSSVLERGSFSLVSTNEELLERKSGGSDLESREFGYRDPSR